MFREWWDQLKAKIANRRRDPAVMNDPKKIYPEELGIGLAIVSNSIIANNRATGTRGWFEWTLPATPRADKHGQVYIDMSEAAKDQGQITYRQNQDENEPLNWVGLGIMAPEEEATDDDDTE